SQRQIFIDRMRATSAFAVPLPKNRLHDSPPLAHHLVICIRVVKSDGLATHQCFEFFGREVLSVSDRPYNTIRVRDDHSWESIPPPGFNNHTVIGGNHFKT